MQHINEVEKVEKIVKGWTVRKTIDLPTILFIFGLFSSGLYAWWGLENKVTVNTTLLAEINIGYKVADEQILDNHQTEFVRMENEIDDLSDGMSAQAVSLGKIEAGQEYMQRTLDTIVEAVSE